jgi:hypothetical protein
VYGFQVTAPKSPLARSEPCLNERGSSSRTARAKPSLGWWVFLVLLSACSSSDRPARSGLGLAGGTGGTLSSALGGSTPAAQGGTEGNAGEAPLSTGGSPEVDADGMGGEADAGADVPVEAPPTAGDCVADPLQAPSGGECIKTGDPGYACNPVSGTPCDVLGGETCEYDGAGFTCQAIGETAQACRPCRLGLAPSCAANFTCRGTLHRCSRYCCGDLDCGPGVPCVLQPPSKVGICQALSNRALQDFGWDLVSPDAGPDASPDSNVDAESTDADDAADEDTGLPPVDCPSCSGQSCQDRERACANDASCASCLGSETVPVECYALVTWQSLLACRCAYCETLCPDSCL